MSEFTTSTNVLGPMAPFASGGVYWGSANPGKLVPVVGPAAGVNRAGMPMAPGGCGVVVWSGGRRPAEPVAPPADAGPAPMPAASASAEVAVPTVNEPRLPTP